MKVKMVVGSLITLSIIEPETHDLPGVVSIEDSAIALKLYPDLDLSLARFTELITFNWVCFIHYEVRFPYVIYDFGFIRLS